MCLFPNSNTISPMLWSRRNVITASSLHNLNASQQKQRCVLINPKEGGPQSSKALTNAMKPYIILYYF